MSSFFEMEMGVVYVCLHVGICIRVDRFPSFSIVFHCSFLDVVTYKFHQPLQNSSKKLLNASIWDICLGPDILPSQRVDASALMMIVMMMSW
jgi:hypothetical protein